MSNGSPALTVSVITVCLNSQETLQRAVDSVRDQTYPNVEYLVIDGESNDQTIDIIRQNLESIHFFLSEPDKGVYHAMNKGIRNSNGNVLFFLNADDYFADTGVIADVAAIFDRDQSIELVFGNQMFDHGDHCSRKRQSFSITRKQLARMTIQHQTIFARKQLFDKTDGFLEQHRIVSDYDWILKVFLMLNCRYRYINRDISVMSTSGLSWSTEFEKERIQVMKRHYSFWEILRWRILPQKYQEIKRFIRR